MKLTKIIIILVLIAALAAPLFLAGCGSDEADAQTAAPSDKTSDTTGVSWDTADAPDTAEQTTEQTTASDYVNPLEGLETISEDTSVTNDDSGISLRELKFYRNQQFEKNGVTYHWFSFYNACIRGELKLTDPDVVTYVEECYEFFEENNVAKEIVHAKTLLDAAAQLAG